MQTIELHVFFVGLPLAEQEERQQLEATQRSLESRLEELGIHGHLGGTYSLDIHCKTFAGYLCHEYFIWSFLVSVL